MVSQATALHRNEVQYSCDQRLFFPLGASRLVVISILQKKNNNRWHPGYDEFHQRFDSIDESHYDKMKVVEYQTTAVAVFHAVRGVSNF